ncbi:hypothetical protein CDD82_1482 [Ophiocordyceps australis]|uniref:Uncharacterized protein n=1 Tax=Ophiocordyceps australis TaxID=1399860 RepID=A0A2C5ZN54_9HYPO|nr:hypothetical protein CDD82_1482 [Ophiocordyceps australis]
MPNNKSHSTAAAQRNRDWRRNLGNNSQGARGSGLQQHLGIRTWYRVHAWYASRGEEQRPEHAAAHGAAQAPRTLYPQPTLYIKMKQRLSHGHAALSSSQLQPGRLAWFGTFGPSLA